ncbi:dockerin type I domain-containing protein [Aeoliella sp. SH292]|uniref:dockerin type I domain-containing protein n=1 Tax=Aeoliella sp. SH292 TaxID=3454464 RepID=UPI003F970991
MLRSLPQLDSARLVLRAAATLVVLSMAGISCGANFADSYRWTSTATDGGSLAQGDGITLRWSIANDSQALTLNNSPVGSSNLISFLDGIYGGAGSSGVGYSSRPWFSILESQFASIASRTGITFQYVADTGSAWNTSPASGAQADIRVGGFDFPSPGELGRGALPALGGDIVLDTANDTFENPALLGGVLQHELGHSLGLLHVNVPGVTALMNTQTIPTLGPQFDDLYALTRLYGDRFEKAAGNDTAATATWLGALAPGTSVLVGSSTDDGIVEPAEVDFVTIDGTSDVDLYRVNVPFTSRATISLVPVGPSYSFTSEGFGPQSMVASSLSNLRFRVLASDGVTPVVSVSNTGIGAEERVDAFALPGAGTYYVEVRGQENVNQFYRLNVLADETPAKASRTVFQDNFNASGDVNANLSELGRQATGNLDSPYQFTTAMTPSGDPAVEIENGQLVMRAVQGAAGADSPAATLIRNFGTEVAGERWLVSFHLNLTGSAASSGVGFAMTLNDSWPIAEPLSDAADLTIALTTNNGYRVVERDGVGTGETTRTGTRAGPDYLVQMLVDETTATPRVTVALNGVTVLSNESISLSAMERYLSLQMLTLSNLPTQSTVTATVDSLSMTVLTGSIAGDFNLDGVVNLADYSLWRDQLGLNVLPGTLADASGNGTIDAADYAVWKNNFGTGPGAMVATTRVPEPTEMAWMLLAGVMLLRVCCIAQGR